MRILFRCDASTAIGSGHAMRCLALAQAAAQAGHCVAFAFAHDTPHIAARVVRTAAHVGAGGWGVLKFGGDIESGSSRDATKTLELARGEHADWIVIDGYQFGTDYQKALIAGSDARVLAFDDHGHAGEYSAHLILNQNFKASEKLYENRAANTQLLLGSEYALLRGNFMRWKDWNRAVRTDATRVLLTMGGSDPDDATGRVLKVLNQQPRPYLELDVVAGGSNPHIDKLHRLCKCSTFQATLTIDADDMDERMARADVAISAGGSTCWELCFMQTPMILVALAENQWAICDELSAAGAAISLGTPRPALGDLPARLESLLKDAQTRAKMSALGRRIVDGHGAERVLEAMARTTGSQ